MIRYEKEITPNSSNMKALLHLEWASTRLRSNAKLTCSSLVTSVSDDFGYKEVGYNF